MPGVIYPIVSPSICIALDLFLFPLPCVLDTGLVWGFVCAFYLISIVVYSILTYIWLLYVSTCIEDAVCCLCVCTVLWVCVLEAWRGNPEMSSQQFYAAILALLHSVDVQPYFTHFPKNKTTSLYLSCQPACSYTKLCWMSTKGCLVSDWTRISVSIKRNAKKCLWYDIINLDMLNFKWKPVPLLQYEQPLDYCQVLFRKVIWGNGLKYPINCANFLKREYLQSRCFRLPLGCVVAEREGEMRARMKIPFNVKFNEQQPLTFKLQRKAH